MGIEIHHQLLQSVVLTMGIVFQQTRKQWFWKFEIFGCFMIVRVLFNQHLERGGYHSHCDLRCRRNIVFFFQVRLQCLWPSGRNASWVHAFLGGGGEVVHTTVCS